MIESDPSRLSYIPAGTAWSAQHAAVAQAEGWHLGDDEHGFYVGHKNNKEILSVIAAKVEQGSHTHQLAIVLHNRMPNSLVFVPTAWLTPSSPAPPPGANDKMTPLIFEAHFNVPHSSGPLSVQVPNNLTTEDRNRIGRSLAKHLIAEHSLAWFNPGDMEFIAVESRRHWESPCRPRGSGLVAIETSPHNWTFKRTVQSNPEPPSQESAAEPVVRSEQSPAKASSRRLTVLSSDVEYEIDELGFVLESRLTGVDYRLPDIYQFNLTEYAAAYPYDDPLPDVFDILDLGYTWLDLDGETMYEPPNEDFRNDLYTLRVDEELACRFGLQLSDLGDDHAARFPVAAELSWQSLVSPTEFVNNLAKKHDLHEFDEARQQHTKRAMEAARRRLQPRQQPTNKE